MLKIFRNERLALRTSMRIGGEARYFASVSAKDDLTRAAEQASSLGLPLVPLGDGTNAIFKDGSLGIFVAKMDIPGFDIAEGAAGQALVRIGAGENWDSAVERASSMGLSGIEALSGIPGTAGAAPVQNIGAYGQEIGPAVVEVEAFDLEAMSFVAKSGEECRFGYRSSMFNGPAKGRFIISSVLLRLSRSAPATPRYPGVAEALAARGIGSPSPSDVRDAVMEIRASKLPDPRTVPNSGSFFKNPVVSESAFEAISREYPDARSFPADGGVKVPAGWLIEKCGFKGQRVGRIGVYGKNALVLTNEDGASFEELMEAKRVIADAVLARFGIALEQEPETIG